MKFVNGEGKTLKGRKLPLGGEKDQTRGGGRGGRKGPRKEFDLAYIGKGGRSYLGRKICTERG